jgi:hypothetical protein
MALQEHRDKKRSDNQIPTVEFGIGVQISVFDALPSRLTKIN